MQPAVIAPVPVATRLDVFHVNANPPVLHAHNGPAAIEADRITMEDFLNIARIGLADLETRHLIEHHKISHWSYFRLSTEQQLHNLGFNAGPARLLCLGVPRALLRAGDVNQ
jgi:hypothetical protein